MRYRILDKGAFALVGLRRRIPNIAQGPNPDMAAFTEAVDDPPGSGWRSSATRSRAARCR
ncbi:hypothetical protein CLV72_1011153 [Allonocardiopsis opalescens]|uniref:Uncharacterized protein n=1 Tax=Allonocardiopsis opalescens TaxID=1144618 RepID=A0A2T0QFC5_9ACTN|nr:hypothetical protein CLV72_1011153 [Allonocardiopsis opalescens]